MADRGAAPVRREDPTGRGGGDRAAQGARPRGAGFFIYIPTGCRRSETDVANAALGLARAGRSPIESDGAGALHPLTEPAPARQLGHVGYYLAKVAHEAGFGVHVIDDRAAFANAERFPFAASVVVDDIPQWLANTQIPSTAYAVIVNGSE